MIGFQMKRTLLLGIKSIWLHGLRSFLTVLGMLFGVASVISMLAIGEGASYEAQEQIKQLGSTNIIVRSVKPPEDRTAGRGETQRVATYGLTYTDVERIAQTIPTVKVTVPARRIRKEVWHLQTKTGAFLVGTVPWMPSINNRTVAEGRFLTSDDLHFRANCAVLERGVADALFPFGDAVGESIKVGMDYYRVVGIMAPPAMGKKGDASDDASSLIYIPITTARSRFGDTLMTISSGSMLMEHIEIHEITVSVPEVSQVLGTADIIRQTLRKFHPKQDYELRVPLEQLQTAQRIKRISDIVLGGIAALSLLVGGIGIMNIMLASVTERTREIGIRRALGAKRRHIIFQFLVETVLLSLFGGIIGIAVGVIIPVFVQYFAEMRTIVTFFSLAIAFTISVVTGIVFGLYPAYRAANMDPIEALRHE